MSNGVESVISRDLMWRSAAPEQYKKGQNDQECEVEHREQSDIIAGFALVLIGVFPEGDEACQRCDQCAYATDIHAQQQIPVIVGELGQQDRGRYVTDHLAGGYGKQQGAFAQQERE